MMLLLSALIFVLFSGTAQAEMQYGKWKRLLQGPVSLMVLGVKHVQVVE